MKKFAIASFSLVAILLLSMLPFMGSFGIKTAEASNQISIQWGHLYVNQTTGEFDEDEKSFEEDVCEYISGLFYDESYYDWYAYWDYTTDDYVEDCMDIQNDPGYDVDFVTNWWVGDFYADLPPPNPFGHFKFYGHDGNHISDYLVRYWATDGGTISSKQYFNFIWTCANGGLWWNDNSGNFDNVSGIFYPLPTSSPVPTNTNDEYGFLYNGVSAVGMPYAWTGRIDMNIDGYNSISGDYCYIGFEGTSPFMKNNLPEIGITAANFPCRFYRYLLGVDYPYLHRSVRESLNYASDHTYDCDFDDTCLYTGYWNYTTTPVTGWWFCHMRVFGNGNLQMP
jgi:hypothetical protein